MAPPEEAASGTTDALASELVVRLDTVMPPALPAGCAGAAFCIGSCFHRREDIESLEIVVEGTRHRPAAFAMPRPDVLQSLQQRHAAATSSPATGTRSVPPGLELRSYRSGFWATVPIWARADRRPIGLGVAVRLADGTDLISELGSIEVVEPRSFPASRLPLTPASRAPSTLASPAGRDRLDDGLIAVCMATFEPDLRLFRTQIESLRAQSDYRWICLISDDCSSPERFAEIERVLDGDRRFVLSRSEVRLGFYRNFERALTMVPDDAELVALSDQDDRWHPEKLEVLRGALGRAQLVYSDQRLVDAEGHVLRHTLWKGRRNNYANLASELVANTIAGAAMLLRREVLQLALPFPDAPGALFHDHWLGMVAMASGDVAYVDRPLYDYVQHAGAVFGDVTQRPEGFAAQTRKRGPRPRRWQGRLDGWRAAYFYGYLPREVQAQTLLVRAGATLASDKARILARFIASSRSPVAFAWLAIRPLRAAAGLNETLGSEVDLVRGIAWRWLIAVRARRARLPDRVGYDARPADPASFEQRRLRRWRARL